MKCFPNFCKVSFLLPDILARAGHVAFYVDRRLSAREETASQHGHFSSHYFQRLRFNNSAIICFLWNQDVSKFGLYNRILYNRSLGSLGQTSSLISGDIILPPDHWPGHLLSDAANGSYGRSWSWGLGWGNTSFEKKPKNCLKFHFSEKRYF